MLKLKFYVSKMNSYKHVLYEFSMSVSFFDNEHIFCKKKNKIWLRMKIIQKLDGLIPGKGNHII